MRITIVAIGSRGDVQPLVALGLGLKAAGHEVRLVAGDDFETFIAEYSLPFYSIGVRMQETMQAHTNIFRFADSITGSILKAFETAGDTDAVIATVLGVCTCRVARERGIPFFYAVPIPGERTRQLPYPLFPPLPLGGAYNLLTHVMMEKLIQRSYAPIRCLFEQPRPTYLHCFSEQIIPRPPDWEDYAKVTGYWFLHHAPNWQPPDGLVSFLEAGTPPLFVGFGSTLDKDAGMLAKRVIEALTGRRAVLVAGWGGLRQTDLPENLFLIKSVPYDWLFPRVTAAVHHGGAGTTAWALWAGIPSVVVPFGLDQPFWGRQVERLGVGTEPIPRRRLTAAGLAAAIQQAADDETIRTNAQAISRRIKGEDGVGNAVQIIEQVVAKGMTRAGQRSS